MASWGDAKLIFCILFLICCFKGTVAQFPIDCCLTVSTKEIDKRLIADYRDQASSCPVVATILVTRRGKNLCAPSKNVQWVQTVMKHVDHLKKRCKMENYKGKRCFGVKHE